MSSEELKRRVVNAARQRGLLPAQGTRARRAMTSLYRSLTSFDVRPSNRGVAQAYRLFDADRVDQAYDMAASLPSAQHRRPAYWRLMRDIQAARGEISEQVLWEAKLAEQGVDVDRFLRTSSTLKELSGWTPRVAAPHERVVPADPWRIVHLVKESRPYFHNGFAARSHYNFLAEVAAGLDPVVVTEPSSVQMSGAVATGLVEHVDGIAHHRLELAGVDRTSIPADEFLQLFAELAYARVKQIRPSLIHASSGRRGFDTGLVGLALKEATGLPLVYEVRSMFEGNWTRHVEREERGEVYERRRATENRVMAGADLVLTICQTMADDIVDRGIPRDKVGIIPNGVDTSVFVPAGRDAELAARYGIAPEHRTFGYVSNMDHFRESQETLIEAAALLRADPRWRCVLVGGGPRKPQMEALARRLGVADRVIFTGPVDHADISAYYGLIDIFVVPRIPERAARLVTPLKPFEAMATHRPVVVSDLPALREVVDPPRRGEVFTPGDAADLVRVLWVLDAHPERRAELADAGLAWVRAERTWAANGDRYRRYFAPLVTGDAL